MFKSDSSKKIGWLQKWKNAIIYEDELVAKNPKCNQLIFCISAKCNHFFEFDINFVKNN